MRSIAIRTKKALARLEERLLYLDRESARSTTAAVLPKPVWQFVDLAANGKLRHATAKSTHLLQFRLEPHRQAIFGSCRAHGGSRCGRR